MYNLPTDYLLIMCTLLFVTLINTEWFIMFYLKFIFNYCVDLKYAIF